jgi:hypothetical protein
MRSVAGVCERSIAHDARLMSRLRVALVCMTLVATSAHAQQTSPPLAGTNGVQVPMLQQFVTPGYAAIALLEKPVWVVKVEALVGPEGRVEQVRIVEPEVPPERGRSSSSPGVSAAAITEVRTAVEQSVRGWVFESPDVSGNASAVLVPITVRYEVFSQPAGSFFTEPPPPGVMPDDFSLRYMRGDCVLDTGAGTFTVAARRSAPSETIPLSLRSDELDSIYQEMRRVRMFEYSRKLRAHDEHGTSVQRDAAWAVTSSGVLVEMRLDFSTPRPAQPPVEYRFELRQNGITSTVQWIDGSAGPPIAREVEGMRAVVAVVKRVLDRHAEVRDLDAVVDDCRHVP